MSKHTPGPWSVRTASAEIIDVDHGLLPFSLVAGYTLIGALYEDSANARLIAAAPDLLDALQECLNCEFAVTDKAAINKARAAIAKAEGQA